jgi:polar amino acid transport system substrate-binding protein
MTSAYRPAARAWAAAFAGILALGVTACAPSSSSSGGGSPAPTSGTSATADSCSVDKLNLLKPGTLTVATDQPAYDPWFSSNDPSNGKGFESAVAYAVAKQLGFSRQHVTWVVEPFNKSYAPGSKDFDFDINQISITPARAKVVDFSTGYYQAAQAVIVLNDSKYAGVTTLAGLKGARIGAQIGTTSLLAAQDDIKPTSQVAVFDDTNAAKQALLNSQVDAIVADLPTAFYITAAEIKGSTILGQFQTTSGHPEEFGMLFEKGNPLVPCVDKAIGALKRNGALHRIEKRWLSSDVHVPELS